MPPPRKSHQLKECCHQVPFCVSWGSASWIEGGGETTVHPAHQLGASRKTGKGLHLEGQGLFLKKKAKQERKITSRRRERRGTPTQKCEKCEAQKPRREAMERQWAPWEGKKLAWETRRSSSKRMRKQLAQVAHRSQKEVSSR